MHKYIVYINGKPHSISFHKDAGVANKHARALGRLQGFTKDCFAEHYQNSCYAMIVEGKIPMPKGFTPVAK